MKAYIWTYCMCYSNICPNCENLSNEIVQIRIYRLLRNLAKLEQVYKVIFRHRH